MGLQIYNNYTVGQIFGFYDNEDFIMVSCYLIDYKQPIWTMGKMGNPFSTHRSEQFQCHVTPQIIHQVYNFTGLVYRSVGTFISEKNVSLFFCWPVDIIFILSGFRALHMGK